MQPRGEARLEEEHEPHRGHEAQRAVVVPRFLVAGHTVVLEVVQDVPVDVGEIQHEGRPVPLGEFPVRPLDEQVARADFHQGVVLAHIARAEGVDALRAAAGDAVHAGAGVIADRFDLDALLQLSQTHQPDLAFSHWVKQADWLILREFRPDLLMEETPASLWHRLSTRWIYRFGKLLSI